MGLIKLCIIILVFIFTVWVILGFVGFMTNFMQVEEDVYLDRVCHYALKENGFCQSGEMEIINETIICKQKFVITEFKCDNIECVITHKPIE